MDVLHTELDDLTRRLVAMPLADQYEFAARVEHLLNLDQPLLKDKATRRAASIVDLRRAAVHLGVEGRPLKKVEYEQASREIGLMSWNKIFRIWDSFELGASIAVGARPPKTWRQRDFERHYLPRRRRFAAEEYLTAVRRWLDSEPLTEASAAYDEFALEHNRLLQKGGVTLPRLHAVRSALALPFSEIVVAARGERSYPAVVVDKRTEEWTRGPHDLVTTTTVALIGAHPVHVARAHTRRSDFPRPALVIRATQMWLREEVSAYFAGERPAPLVVNRLRGTYLTRAETAERLSLGAGTLPRGVAGQLEPVGVVGHVMLYLREEIDDFVATHSHEIKRRQRTKQRPGTTTGPRQSEFVTLASLAREFCISGAQMSGILQEEGFPEPYRRFGEGGIWLRSELKDYFAGRPIVPRAGREEPLLRSDEVNALLGYAPGATLSDKPKDFPEPVARTGVGNVFARADIEAYLDADPVRRARVEARRRHRAGGDQPSASRASSQASVSAGEGYLSSPLIR